MISDNSVDKIAVALTIAGSDSGGGAGIQADLKTFSALGVYGASVITAVTAQNTCAVNAVHEIPANIVGNQINTVLSDIAVGAIKIGMLFSSDIIIETAECLKMTNIPIILDPVMIAKSGDELLQASAVKSLIEHLVPLCELLTPNLPEAAMLLGATTAKNTQEMHEQAKALLDLGPKTVLLKGGHGNGDICNDILLGQDGQFIQLSAKRQATKNTHGTGCTYSAAITAMLTRGNDLATSVGHAHIYLQNAIKAADQLEIGQGHGPVHHFYYLWGNL